MRRILAVLVAAVLTAAFLCLPTAPAAALTRSEQWRAIGETAIARYEAATPPTSFKPMVWSAAMLAYADLRGWSDPHIPVLIDRLMDARNPDGGWGVSAALDAWQDGTKNPASTTYTVTLSGHVGPALLRAYQAGVFTDPEPLQTVVKLLMTTAKSTTSAGDCFAYSRAAADVPSADRPCIHNVNASVAHYLLRSKAAGFDRGGLAAQVTSLTRREISAYNVSWAGWPYADGRTVAQELDHGSYSALLMLDLAYPIGREAMTAVVGRQGTDVDTVLGHLRIAASPPGPPVFGGSWCAAGDRYIAEAQNAAQTWTSATDLAAIAQGAARNAAACAEPGGPGAPPTTTPPTTRPASDPTTPPSPWPDPTTAGSAGRS
ncbi:hypothetical protein [Actinoplanes siamensis]|uniref:Terpene cyclase/mutase family protein n=1 Tax=Actinoplanes siamensis TaxID=1223317 RepID=A0A919NDA8_9ACTN|nr:hypothetical protein [Actinoplanes siamensis]GIF08645.1 hypothetical protein Asi03nite_61830 [Actinoplanes siamensis]